jgi:hypothetical protein
MVDDTPLTQTKERWQEKLRLHYDELHQNIGWMLHAFITQLHKTLEMYYKN